MFSDNLFKYARYKIAEFTITSQYSSDSTGKIEFKEIGYTTEMGLRTRLWLAGD